MITPENITSHELIGLRTEIIESSNPQIIGLNGTVTDETKSIIQLMVFQHIFKKPAKEFLVFMKEIVSNSENGNRLMETLVRAIEEDINNYDYEQTMAEFDEDLTGISDETDNDELKGFLNNLGVDLPSGGNDEEDDDDSLFDELGLDRPTK